MRSQGTLKYRCMFQKGLLLCFVLLGHALAAPPKEVDNKSFELKATVDFSKAITELERARIMRKANLYLSEQVLTISSVTSPRSMGTKHDFFSEGDYWWPNPEDPDGPYIRRDGESNPDNFVDHRKLLMRFSDIVATLSSAYLISDNKQYLNKTIEHLQAWFIHSSTRMNPSLLYGQAIQGRYTGRSIGIIDTIHLVEVAKSIEVLIAREALPDACAKALKAWFSEYLMWLNTHEYGLKEKHHPNNHGITWSMQAASFARLANDQETLKWIRQQFKKVYIKQMMNINGGFDAELARTKPYAYSLFVIDAMMVLAELASTENDKLWEFIDTDDQGNTRSLAKGMAFITPFIADKSSWPYQQDIQYWDEWPVRHISLMLHAKHTQNTNYLSLFATLQSDPQTYEIIRNTPVRHPLLWL
ncbi:alginate lyase family protein [Ningiella sp. W23]|uniref:alginate lyase family protein n=1 Tax=Ningiella sp. W23 TaxID=3023715 RepID=UPI0037581E63